MDSTDWYLSEHNQSPTFKPTLATYKPTGYRNRMSNNQTGGANKVDLPGPNIWKRDKEAAERKWRAAAKTLRDIQNRRKKNQADIERYTKQVKIGKHEERRAEILLTLYGGNEELQKEREDSLLKEKREIDAKLKKLEDGEDDEEDDGEADKAAHDKKDDGKAEVAHDKNGTGKKPKGPM